MIDPIPFPKEDTTDAMPERDTDIDVTDEQLAALTDEASAIHNDDLKAFAENLLEQKGPVAIQQIAILATSAQGERVRLDASKYIVDRILGSVNKVDPSKSEENDPILRLMKAMAATTATEAQDGTVEG